ncbi:glycoside hydrolase [Coniochaeta sp. PMI_546]|nr:glycoside hydrolase [Coniochaeta sp. PMI_546]
MEGTWGRKLGLLEMCVGSGPSLGRDRISINQGWQFKRFKSNPDGLIYDARPDLGGLENATILKPWVLPSANNFIRDPADRHQRPAGNPGENVQYVQGTFDDSSWETVTLPHDWAIKGPFQQGPTATVGGGMGRLPVNGVGWYRRRLSMNREDEGRSVYLDVDGAMSYAVVWLNGKLVGGWPYPYNTFRLELTPYLKPGDDNQLAIRLDNPVDSARWYPGGGLYRNVWLTKVDETHVGQWGAHITSESVSSNSATLSLTVEIESSSSRGRDIDVITDVYELDVAAGKPGVKAITFPPMKVHLNGTTGASVTQSAISSVKITDPKLWGPPPKQQPNLYVFVTQLLDTGVVIDKYESRFGIRDVQYDPDKGLLINGQHVYVQGINQHHDLGALGAAFNNRAAQRHLELLAKLGCNAIRMSHNPPAPELLDLADEMGFVVFNEIFDCWQSGKTTNDFHIIFDDWHEPDLRAFLGRDRNHASIVAWSVGNEVGEQTEDIGAQIGKMLVGIAHDEDLTRPVTASMNAAKPNMTFPTVFDVLSINYQGEGFRVDPNYSGLPGSHTPPLYDAFHEAFMQKMLWSSETSSALSSRGTYMFPVCVSSGAPVNDTSGGNSTTLEVSAYELYTANFGASPDKVFAAQDTHPFVAGEFVWTGWDYIGEPTPYDNARSSYSGIIDLAGFEKDRFYLYQARWRPDLPMAHILPHWNWPDRLGMTTPVHVFSSGDEAELFLNGHSQGRIKRDVLTYRFRWDDIHYQPGELYVATYKEGKLWATDTVRTTGRPAKLRLTADRTTIDADGYDLSFVTVEVVDSRGDLVRQANNPVTFSYCGAGNIVATDNGFQADFTPFPSLQRNVFAGKAIAIVRSKPGKSGLESASITLNAM